jgi:phosphonate transport system substrate-binding protein
MERSRTTDLRLGEWGRQMLKQRKPLATALSLTLCLLAFLSIAAATAGCDSSDATGARFDVLRIGVLPGENRATQERNFSPLVEYLEQELGIPCQLLLHDSYEELQLAFEDERLDLAWLGGFTFVNVNRSRGAVALVSRDRDFRFTSYFLVRSDETATDLNDFRGKRFAFGSRLSTSGHLMPRYFLARWGIDPETFFGEVLYTDAHDRTVNAVRDGVVDVGVASGVAVDAMLASGEMSDEQLHVLIESPPYLDYVWACQTKMPPALRTEVRDAFLNLTTENPEHAEILNRLSAKYFLAVDSEDFLELRSFIDSSTLAGISQ